MKLKQSYRRTIIFTLIVAFVFIASIIFIPDFKIEINPSDIKVGNILKKVIEIVIDLLKSTWKA